MVAITGFLLELLGLFFLLLPSATKAEEERGGASMVFDGATIFRPGTTVGPALLLLLVLPTVFWFFF